MIDKLKKIAVKAAKDGKQPPDTLQVAPGTDVADVLIKAGHTLSYKVTPDAPETVMGLRVVTSHGVPEGKAHVCNAFGELLGTVDLEKPV